MIHHLRTAAFAVALALPVVSFAAPFQKFTGVLDALNNSGVSGVVNLTLDGNKLTVKIDATGLEADQLHPQHIHGLLDGGFAACPTLEQDTNGDGFISVFEGAAPYGPIKVNLTSPPTPFGPNPNTQLFAPFAGVANNADFPTAPNGDVHFNETITFDPNNADAAAALAAITPLTKQHIVLHGAMAPETVDGSGTSPDNIIYDPLLPVACSELSQVSTAIPLPSAVFPGLMMLGGMAGVVLLRRRVA